MNDYNKYDMFSDFLDGELNHNQEQEFFMKLAGDEDLQDKLKGAISLRGAIASSSAMFTAPIESGAAIFDKLGMSMPSPAKPFSHYAKKFWQSGVISIMAAYILFLQFGGMDNFIDKSDIQFASNSTPIIENTQTSNTPPSEMMNNIPISSQSEEKEEKVKEVIKYVYIDRNQDLQKESHIIAFDDSNDHEDLDSDVSSISMINSSDYNLSLMNRNYSDLRTGSATHSNLLPEGTYSLSQMLPNNNLWGFSIETEANSAWHNHDVNINSKDNALFNNQGISIFYDLNDYLDCGLSFRQENYYMKFSGFNDNGVFVNYEMQPSLFTGAISLRLYPYSWDNIRLFSQGESGVNKAGFVYRFSSGFLYSPYKNIHLILAGEYSYLKFDYNNQSNHQSSKLGFKYGVRIDL